MSVLLVVSEPLEERVADSSRKDLMVWFLMLCGLWRLWMLLTERE